MATTLTGTVALITGTSSGIGEATARRLAEHGAAVALVARRRYRLEALARDIQEAGGTALVVDADITDPAQADTAVRQTVEHFGRLDTLVNNAGNFNAGFFEELASEEFRAQIETTLFGPVNVTRATLPIMRGQRSGLVVTISSTAGIVGGEFRTAYAASKFGVEGWMESLSPEVAPLGIRTMLVEPGFFRTELLSPESTKYAESSIGDYAERTEHTVTAWQRMNGRQGGDPAKLADALVRLAAQDEPPLRFPAGADAVATFENRANLLLELADANRELSSNLDHDDV